jgi:hypothetical protein
MQNRVRALAVSGAAVIVVLVLSLASAGAGFAQQKGAEKKFDKAQTQEIQALVKLVNDVTAGKPAPADFPVTWQNHSLKARDQRTFVPYCISIPQGSMTSPSVAVYVRVVKRGGDAPPAVPAVAGDKKDPKAVQSEFPFEDVYFVDLKAPEGKDPYRLTRALSVAPGDYDVYVTVRERATPDKKGAPTPKASLLKQPMTVPNYWLPELMLSSIIVAEKVEPLTAPIPESQVAENPYALGMTRFVPAADNRKFSKKEELSIIFLIYNTNDTNKKPDVTVEYNFSQKADGGEKFFNKTNPQAFNAETLPPQFDTATGHQIVAGQSVPLASFPEGEYRLEIKVTDKVSGKTLVQNVLFTVTL